MHSKNDETQILDNATEAEIIDGLHRGEERIYKGIYYLYAKALRDFCNRIIENKDDTQDIVTEVFEKLWINKNDIQTITHLRGFLYSVAKNACLQYLRNKKRKKHHYKTVLAALEKSEDSILSYMVHAELRLQLRQAVAMLPPQRQAIVKKLVIDGKTVREVAYEMNIGEGYVLSAKSKALTTLREILTKGGALAILVLLYIALNIIQLLKKALPL